MPTREILLRPDWWVEQFDGDGEEWGRKVGELIARGVRTQAVRRFIVEPVFARLEVLESAVGAVEDAFADCVVELVARE